MVGVDESTERLRKQVGYVTSKEFRINSTLMPIAHTTSALSYQTAPRRRLQ